MENITGIEVEKLAKLARLGLTKDETILFSKQMSEILNYSKILDEVDTKGVEPTSQVTGASNVFREDEVIDCEIKTEELLSNTPSTEGDFIKVGTVL
jgi:aspartyl-tRNA(Asn)/glutamyl-tRNA(Gln) amidotransferase subunit C